MIVINIFDYEECEDDSCLQNKEEQKEKELPEVRELQKQVVTIYGEIIPE